MSSSSHDNYGNHSNHSNHSNHNSDNKCSKKGCSCHKREAINSMANEYRVATENSNLVTENNNLATENNNLATEKSNLATETEFDNNSTFTENSCTNPNKCCPNNRSCTSCTSCSSSSGCCCKPCHATVFVSTLNGGSQVPPNNSCGIGYFQAVLSADRARFEFVLKTRGLCKIKSAHIHCGAAGKSGCSVKTININVCTGCAVGVWTKCDSFEPLTNEWIKKLLCGLLYVDVHTMCHPSGEIRGQINPLCI